MLHMKSALVTWEYMLEVQRRVAVRRLSKISNYAFQCGYYYISGHFNLRDIYSKQTKSNQHEHQSNSSDWKYQRYFLFRCKYLRCSYFKIFFPCDACLINATICALQEMNCFYVTRTGYAPIIKTVHSLGMVENVSTAMCNLTAVCQAARYSLP